MAEYDVVIIGAGIAGCTMAHALATLDSARPLKIALLERSLAEPDRIVGELLQPGGMNALKSLGHSNTQRKTLGRFRFTDTRFSTLATPCTFRIPMEPRDEASTMVESSCDSERRPNNTRMWRLSKRLSVTLWRRMGGLLGHGRDARTKRRRRLELG